MHRPAFRKTQKEESAPASKSHTLTLLRNKKGKLLPFSMSIFLFVIIFYYAYHAVTYGKISNTMKTSLQIDSDSGGVIETATPSPSCKSNLNDMALSMARYSTPVGSNSFLKHKRVLTQATKFHMSVTGQHLIKGIFSDTIVNIIQMLKGYGLEQNFNETIDSDIAHNDTILIDFAVFAKQIPTKCRGSKCHSIPRISLQTEQIIGLNAQAHANVVECHTSPNCLIWDFSDINFEWAKSIVYNGKTYNASESFMIVPHMFHNRLKDIYPKDENELVPYQERSTDAVFYGLLTRRRQQFMSKYVNKDTGTSLSRCKLDFRKNMRPVGSVAKGYSNAKICLVVHSRIADSAGEYHRISDFKRFGCVPIMETFGDKMLVETLSSCAGMKFADYDDIPNAVIRELKRINETSADILRGEQLSIDRWWNVGIEWNNLLG